MKYIGRDSSGEIYDTEEKIKDYIREMTTLGDVREYFDNSGDYTLSVEREDRNGVYDRVIDDYIFINTWMEYFERYINDMYEIGDWGLDKCRVFKKLTISKANVTIAKLGKPSIIRLDDVKSLIEPTVEDVFLTEEEFNFYDKCQGTFDVRGYFTGSVLIDEEIFTQSLNQRYNLKTIFAHEFFAQAVENDLLFKVAFESWKNREDEKE